VVPVALSAAEDARTRLRPTLAALVALLVAGSAVLTVMLRAPSTGGTASAASDYTQVTNVTDSAFLPALSPDGRMLAFIRGQTATIGGTGDIFIKLLPDGEPVRLTHDGGKKMKPTFTPGGDRVAYGVPSLMTNPKNWSTWTVPVIGGDSRLVLNNASALSWVPGASPSRVVFSEVDSGIHMAIVTAAEDGTDGRVVYSPVEHDAMAHVSFPSPDRKHLLVAEMEDGWRPCRLVPLERGRQSGPPAEAGALIGPPHGQCSGAAWSTDGQWMYLSVDTGDGYHIWRQRFPDGTPVQITQGATEEEGLAIAPDGQSFFTSIGIRQSTLWIHDARGERQITSEGYASLPRFSPDGRKIYFLMRSRASRRYVSGELWSVNIETGQREHLDDSARRSRSAASVIDVGCASRLLRSRWRTVVLGSGRQQEIRVPDRRERERTSQSHSRSHHLCVRRFAGWNGAGSLARGGGSALSDRRR
jgi:Tol biopolymer transport system component